MTPDIRAGRRRLRELLPWARAEAAKGTGRFELKSTLAKATAAYVTEDNLDALIIYPAPLGGWHADMLFKKVPPGVPNTMGTPVEKPCRTRAEAEEAAKAILVMMLTMAQQAQPPAPPVFMLHDFDVRLLPEAIEAAAQAFPDEPHAYESKEHAIERIEAVLAALFPEGFSGERFDALDLPNKARFLSVLHIAAVTGVFVYPPRRDKSPETHH